MTPEEGYQEAERRIEEAQKLRTKELRLSKLWLTKIPSQIVQLFQLKYLYLSNNQIVEIPDAITKLSRLSKLDLDNNQIVEIPDEIAQLNNLRQLNLSNNQIVEIPDEIAQLSRLDRLDLNNNPLNPALAAVYEQGLSELKKYLIERAKSQITLNEGKLILVGEGAVGKSCGRVLNLWKRVIINKCKS